MLYQFLILENFFTKKLLKWLIVDYVFLLSYLLLYFFNKNSMLFNPISIQQLLVFNNYKDLSLIPLILLLYNVFLTIYITYNIYI